MIALMKKEDFVTVRDRFRAEKFAMTLCERASTATITVGPEAPEIIVGDILKDEDEPGAGIVWRVNKVDTDYNTNTRTITCNHVISLLKEKLLFGEHTTATVANRAGATTCTAKEAMRYVLSFQRDFELNDFPQRYEGVSNAYAFNGDTLFSAMETISTTLDDCWWEYDLRTYPFKLNIRDRQQAFMETEFRLSRNVQNAKLTVDRSNMFTMLFPIGKNDLQLPEKYISRHMETYGMICKTMTDQTKETEADLRTWAETELKHNADPAVTVTISAMDLSQQTGEPLDHIKLGAACQMPLPGYNTYIKERINRMAWSDKIKDPDNVTVTLANTRDTVSTIVASTISSTSKSSRTTNTNYSKGVLDISIDLKEGTNDYILWRQDYKGVWKDVSTFSRAVASWTVSATGGTIKVTAKPQEQSKEVSVQGAAGSWSGNIFSGSIEYSEDKKKWYATGANYRVDATARYNAGYNDGWGAARKKVSLPTSEVTNQNSILIKVPASTVGGTESRSYIVSDAAKNYADLETKVGNSYVTVARLTHNRYNGGWGAAYGKVSVPTTEVTNQDSILIKTPPSTVDGAAESTSYILFSTEGDKNSEDLKTLVNGEYVTVARHRHFHYNDGWNAAYAMVELPKTEVTNINSILIKTPTSTVDGGADLTSYIMWSSDNNHVDLQTLVDNAYVTVARYTHGKYDAGWADALAQVSIPTAEDTAHNSFYIYTPSSTPGYQIQNSYLMTAYSGYTDLRYWSSADNAWITVARVDDYHNKSGTLYYDSYTYTQGNFVYYYHQTISQQSQAIVTSGSRLVRWHG